MELDDSCPDCLDLAEGLRMMSHKIKTLNEDLTAYKKTLASVASERNVYEHKLEKIKAIAQSAKCEDVCPDQCYSAEQILKIIEGE